MYSLTSQIRRAAVSITANIAEGCGRNSEADFAHFLQIAFGSASELSYFLLLSKDLNLMDIGIFNALDNQLSECMKMLSGLLKSVRLRINPKPKT
jgi:four helix bundle protein